jgi:hypothetical protein
MAAAVHVLFPGKGVPFWVYTAVRGVGSTAGCIGRRRVCGHSHNPVGGVLGAVPSARGGEHRRVH